MQVQKCTGVDYSSPETDISRKWPGAQPPPSKSMCRSFLPQRRKKNKLNIDASTEHPQPETCKAFWDKLFKDSQSGIPLGVLDEEEEGTPSCQQLHGVFRPFGKRSIREQVKCNSSQPWTCQPFYGIIPRISIEMLELPGCEAYKARRRPFILTNALAEWGALERWPIDSDAPPLHAYLARKFPTQVSDYYPHNMHRQGSHPYLVRFNFGLSHLMNPELENHFGSQENPVDGRYLHLQLTPRHWQILQQVGDLPAPNMSHKHITFAQDTWWMRRCLETEQYPGDTLKEEFHLKTHWVIILIGSKGAGMFNHTDSLESSSWHAHIQGRKYWYVCGHNEGTGPRQGADECLEAILYPGEVMYYPRQWHHRTLNLETPTMTLTGTVVHAGTYDSVARQLHKQCCSDHAGFMFSAALCDALQTCYSLWYKRWRPQHAKADNMARMFPPWHSVAPAHRVKEMKALRPDENNYDGRNYISGFEQFFEFF